jgi:hypothetical protein
MKTLRTLPAATLFTFASLAHAQSRPIRLIVA